MRSSISWMWWVLWCSSWKTPSQFLHSKVKFCITFKKNHESYYRSARLQFCNKFWTIFNNLIYIESFSLPVLVYLDLSCFSLVYQLGLSWSIMVYLGLFRVISRHFGQKWDISGYLGLSQAISSYLKLSQATMGYLGLKLAQALSGYKEVFESMLIIESDEMTAFWPNERLTFPFMWKSQISY